MKSIAYAIQKLKELLTPKARLWLYAVAVAAFSLMLYYNVVDEKAAPLWLNLISTVFVVGGQVVATAHIPRSGSPKTDETGQ
ncbi:hypothetical protein [Mycobacteroides chelonae]|jgi:hypothetical protein|uniref:hypothetical protein n=1 Tax=Mycobacteroides chelonae TaxID=1774 RepID=UPI0008A9AAA3|nr:hypothetical protein [Mycobacteroides chelonae]MBF9325991.1 hypothetical protein [Mycobacteroides chelonae]MBF9420167.1 hypothetical protein [Mycobacteroides chelonae]MBF9438635.1 hypothetical protein [Mycobacteroides chelonae]MBV6359935.1 hypothetical protein [Mycobacteroides chelonae]MEC4834453.1 hypothetical protein [Mycobacteroides chelonae]